MSTPLLYNRVFKKNKKQSISNIYLPNTNIALRRAHSCLIRCLYDNGIKKGNFIVDISLSIPAMARNTGLN